MPKRSPTSDLNHTNWDREEEPEEKGTFSKASDEEFKTRVIRKARRRIGGEQSDETSATSAAGSVFSGFAGFGKTASTASTVAATFSFLSKNPSASSSAMDTVGTSTTAKESNSNKEDNSEPLSEYYSSIISLNKAVTDWIKSHIDKDPLCILTPIFQGYERYLKELDDNKNSKTREEKPKLGQSGSFTTFKFASGSSTDVPKPPTANFTFPAAEKKAEISPVKSTSSGNIFGSSSSTGFSFGAKSEENTASTSGFSFGVAAKVDAKAPATSTSGFSFGTKSSVKSTPSSGFFFGNTSKIEDKDKSTAISGFSFGTSAKTDDTTSKPFTFANVAPPAAANGDNEEEDEEPPKNEFKQVVEDDNIFSKKCKIFVKQDGNFADRGVGTLYLKPVADSKRTQLLVRADTNLGNILLNVILNESVPTRRMGKNNVMMVCPTPDCEKPSQVLVRVKTGEEADELLEIVNTHKIDSE